MSSTIKINTKIAVHAYKYDGTLYRTFEFPKVVYEDDQIIVLSLTNVRIISKSKNQKFYHSFSKNDSFWILFKNEWYNLFIIQNDTNKIAYYFNIASPFIYEEGAIKYVDIDLDIKVNDINTQIMCIKQLDEHEFEEHAILMLYPKKLIDKAKDSKEDILMKLQNHVFQEAFDKKIFQPNYWEKLQNNKNKPG